MATKKQKIYEFYYHGMALGGTMTIVATSALEAKTLFLSLIKQTPEAFKQYNSQYEYKAMEVPDGAFVAYNWDGDY